MNLTETPTLTKPEQAESIQITAHPDIRIGTLIQGNAADPAARMHALLPFGFESYSLTFWQNIGEHDLAKLADQVNAALVGSQAKVSSLGVFGNPLETDENGVKCLASWETAIDSAKLYGADIVAGFTGRVRGKSIPDSIPRFTEVWSRLADRAAKNGVRIAFENCSMGGDWNKGDWNIAHCPEAWELMFEAVPGAHLGLEWEPCHQLVRLADIMPQLDDWSSRIIHVHGKDATVDRNRLARYGLGSSKAWCWHRSPGFGDSNWTEIISRLRMHGFKGSIDIEGWHDPVYRNELEMTGQVHALNYLKACRGGQYVTV